CLHLYHRPFLAPRSSIISAAAGPWPPPSHLPVLQHHPALVLGDGLALLDPHDVADLEGVILVVGVKFLRPAHGLLQQRLRVAPFDLHHHGLGVLVGNHDALENALWHVSNLQAFPCASPRRRWLCTVLMRAMSRRTSRTREVFSSWPVARWKRRLNCSLFSLL